MHLDPGEGIVPARFMGKGIDRNVARKLAVDAVEQVEIEPRRHPRRIVIGGDQRSLVLHEVHTDQQQRAFAQRLAHRAQEVCGGAGDHVADGRSGEEAELGQSLDLGGQFHPAHEIGLDRIDRKACKLGRELGRRRAQEIARDIERDIGRRRNRREQQRGLDRGARAKLHHRAPRPDQPGDFLGPPAQDLGFGAGEVIFGELRNVLEQPRSGIVVEPARRHRLLRLGQPGENIGAESEIDPARIALDQLETFACRHLTRPWPAAGR